MKNEKSCGAVIIRNKDMKTQVLVIRQNQGHWCFPKGHVEKDENEHETAMREINEETGLKVGFITGFRESTNYSPEPGVMKKVVYFLAYPTGGKEKVQKEEVSQMKWVSLQDAEALLTYDNDTELLRKAMKFIEMHKAGDLF